jgi:hypothetical protein
MENKTVEVKKPVETWVCEWDNVHGDIVMFTTPKPKTEEKQEQIKSEKNG